MNSINPPSNSTILLKWTFKPIGNNIMLKTIQKCLGNPFIATSRRRKAVWVENYSSSQWNYCITFESYWNYYLKPKLYGVSNNLTTNVVIFVIFTLLLRIWMNCICGFNWMLMLQIANASKSHFYTQNSCNKTWFIYWEHLYRQNSVNL